MGRLGTGTFFVSLFLGVGAVMHAARSHFRHRRFFQLEK